MSRYPALFARLAACGEGAFVPFTTLGDPDLDGSSRVLDALVAGGADALELGLPFSDPVADGPVIQAADVRALAAGFRLADGWRLLRDFRARQPDLPVGLLVYANLVLARGIDTFYAAAAAAGVDSVRVAAVPPLEAGPCVAAAHGHGIDPVLIAPPACRPEVVTRIAQLGQGYTYLVSRPGVTGVDEQAATDPAALAARLAAAGAPPPLLGFGIATPDHVRAARRSGVAGVITGSAVVARLAAHLDDEPARLLALQQYVATMKAATR